MSPCIRTPIDTTDVSPAPGVQLPCVVTADGVELPRCDLQDNGFAAATTTSCWWTELSAPICGGDVLLRVENVPPAAALAASCIAN